MKLSGLVDILNLYTTIPFTEFAWENAPKDGYGVVSPDGQIELKTGEDPAAEKMLTGLVDVFVKATDGDPTEDVEDAMRALGVWFTMESIQFESETGYVHYEWRWRDVLNTVRKPIINELPIMLHIKTQEWSDGDLFLTFEERAAEIYNAIGARDITFYVPIEEERPGGLTVTVNRLMRLSAYTESGNHKTAWFVSEEDGEKRYLRILVDAEASSCSGQGSFITEAAPALVFEYVDGYVTDISFTYRTLRAAFDSRTPVCLYDYTQGENGIVYMTHVDTYDQSGEQMYRAVFVGCGGNQEPFGWLFTATGPDDLLNEV